MKINKVDKLMILLGITLAIAFSAAYYYEHEVYSGEYSYGGIYKAGIFRDFGISGGTYTMILLQDENGTSQNHFFSYDVLNEFNGLEGKNIIVYYSATSINHHRLLRIEEVQQ